MSVDVISNIAFPKAAGRSRISCSRANSASTYSPISSMMPLDGFYGSLTEIDDARSRGDSDRGHPRRLRQ
jgi:hypothetical protein